MTLKVDLLPRKPSRWQNFKDGVETTCMAVLALFMAAMAIAFTFLMYVAGVVLAVLPFFLVAWFIHWLWWK